MVGMQFNEGEKVSYGGAVSRGAVRALGEDGGRWLCCWDGGERHRLQQAWKAVASGAGWGLAALPGQQHRSCLK